MVFLQLIIICLLGILLGVMSKLEHDFRDFEMDVSMKVFGELSFERMNEK